MKNKVIIILAVLMVTLTACGSEATVEEAKASEDVFEVTIATIEGLEQISCILAPN